MSWGKTKGCPSSKAVTWAIKHLIGQYNPDDYDKKYKNWDVDDFLIVPSIWKIMQPQQFQTTI
jgi:DNA topoisomerase-3